MPGTKTTALLHRMKEGRLLNWLLFVLLSFIWGSSFILMKISKEALNGFQIGAIRIFAAGLVFLPFAIFHIREIPGRKIPLVILSGLLGNLFPAFLFAIAIEKIDSSLEGILNSLTPLFVIIIGILFFKAKVETKKIAGVLIGFLGLVILGFASGINGSNLAYALLVILATLLYGLNVNIVSHYLKDLPPVKMATVSLAFLAIPSFAVLWFQDVFYIARYDMAARWPIIASAVLGIVGSAMATALFYILIKRAGGLFASLVTYAIPVVAIMWGLLSHENIRPVQLAGLAVILSGVYLTNKD